MSRRRQPRGGLAEVVADRRVVVCCGSGGVGKTTVSAAIALGMAGRGARVAVVTIDPARRLASALGMEDLRDEARRVPPEAVEAAGLSLRGELWALQLDPKATFDRLVTREAPDERAAEKILANRIYQHLSGSLGGAHEYMAVERLHELMEEGRFDAVVLDTPPAANALDFLDAPQRITRFIEGRALRMLLRPAQAGGGLGMKALRMGSTMVLSLLERLTGAQLLRDVADFLASFDGMYAGFAERAQAVRALLRSERTSFVVVSGPAQEPLREAVSLWRRLERDDFPLGAIVLNRVHELPAAGPVGTRLLEEALARAGAADPAGLAARATAALEESRLLALRDVDAVEGLRHVLGDPPITTVRALVRDPVELEGLAQVTRELLPGSLPARAAAA